MITLNTPRLHLREFVNDDFADVYRYESDPAVVQYVAYGPYTSDECRRDLDWHVAHQQATPRNFYHLALTLPADGRVIGYCGLQFGDDNRHEVELGYALHQDFWGQGYMTEAAQALVAYGFHEMAVHRIWAECRPENIGSIRVLQKLNMTQEAHLRKNRWFKGRWWNTLIFGLLEHEW